MQIRITNDSNPALSLRTGNPNLKTHKFANPSQSQNIKKNGTEIASALAAPQFAAVAEFITTLSGLARSSI